MAMYRCRNCKTLLLADTIIGLNEIIKHIEPKPPLQKPCPGHDWLYLKEGTSKSESEM